MERRSWWRTQNLLRQSSLYRELPVLELLGGRWPWRESDPALVHSRHRGAPAPSKTPMQILTRKAAPNKICPSGGRLMTSNAVGTISWSTALLDAAPPPPRR
jgi:hypothetical protein